jgi:tetrahydromethanopterin S-methyltransferase subunit C
MLEWTKAELLQLAAIVGTVVTAIIGFIVARMVKTVHVLMNSRLTELLKITKSSARAEGVIEGEARAKGKD